MKETAGQHRGGVLPRNIASFAPVACLAGEGRVSMDIHLYLSLTPEALVASMLPPPEFGAYLATGTRKRSREQAIFFEVDSDLVKDHFPLATVQETCVPHPDGTPKHSVYISIYRVLERVPSEAMVSLWLTTRDGRALELEPMEPVPESHNNFHLYQELCPIRPMIVSSLGPVDFCQFITGSKTTIAVPKICFAELALGELADDPADGDIGDLPYRDIAHLRDCLRDLRTRRKITKTVNRIPNEQVFYRCVQGGFYVGDSHRVLRYPLPCVEAMERDHHKWWRSATKA